MSDVIRASPSYEPDAPIRSLGDKSSAARPPAFADLQRQSYMSPAFLSPASLPSVSTGGNRSSQHHFEFPSPYATGRTAQRPVTKPGSPSASFTRIEPPTPLPTPYTASIPPSRDDNNAPFPSFPVDDMSSTISPTAHMSASGR